MTTCIDTIGFIFSKSKVTLKSYRKGCYKYKLALFKLTKEDFVSSTLNISTSVDESWEYLKANVLDFINQEFMISVTRCTKFNSFGARLAKVKVCKCCDVINLYFYYNIIPGINTYCNPQCNPTNTLCIPLVNNSNMPSVSCYPENYWPDINPNNSQSYYPPGPCANIVGNFFYNLDCGTYYDIKFYCKSAICSNPCFTETCLSRAC